MQASTLLSPPRKVDERKGKLKKWKGGGTCLMNAYNPHDMPKKVEEGKGRL